MTLENTAEPKSPVAMRERRTSRCGYTTAAAANLHTGGSGHRVVPHWTEAAVESGSPLSDRAALYRIALLASVA